MTRFQIPYGASAIELEIEADLLELGSGGIKTPIGSAELIRQALRKPLCSRRLRELVASKKDPKIVIVVDDHTRDTPTELMLEALLDEIGEEHRGRITIVVACGTHEPPSSEDINRIIGNKGGKFDIAIHNCDASDLVYVGTTSKGTPVRLNKIYVNADIRVLTGDITLHYYAGFGGGRKSILPGISGRETIQKNHALLVEEHARTAHIENNPVHLDMTEAASFAPPDFVLNVVEAGKGNLRAAFAGDMTAVLQSGIEVAQQLFSLKTHTTYDILFVSAGGFPKDRNLYQASKAIEQCYRAVVPGGELILVAECREGMGDPYFEAWMDAYPTFPETEEAIRTNFVLGGHKAYYLRKVMTRIRLSVVSELNAHKLARWQIKGFKSLSEILQGGKSNTCKIGIVPKGVDTLLVPASNI
ncbi:MAG: nickel-dependent lactate racemase [Methanophagales archaeon ANME-1-THS]|nr:MAG: nickel-dependent lactate racemase [Methanophagales archaeon ANME-1-THS]